jgi:hypothetical protein
MNEERKTEAILELIPNDKLSFEQKAFELHEGKEPFPFYKLLREPINFNDLNLQSHNKCTIWRDNGTMICVGFMSFRLYEGRKLAFRINDMHCAIYGKQDAAIAETAIFLWSLKRLGGGLYIDHCEIFSFAALSAEQFAKALDANPTQELMMYEVKLSTAQSVVLATRSYPLDLTFEENHSAFEDDGAAFITALERRQSSFGSLAMYWEGDVYERMPYLSPENLRRLCNLEVFDKLTLDFLRDRALNFLPFAAKVNTLKYELDAVDIQPEDFDSLDIATKDLSFHLCLSNADNCDTIVISLLNRLASLGHFERLELAIYWYESDDNWGYDDYNSIAEALIRVIAGNPKLSHLNLCKCDDVGFYMNHMPAICNAMEEHNGLTTFIIREIDTMHDGGVYDALARLLSRNRNITVVDAWGKRCSNGPQIDKLYALNAFYNRSAALVKLSSAARPSLVATAMTESASMDFHYTSRLLSNHTDVLCEFLSGVDLDRVPKLKRRFQPERAAKKAARTEM